MFLSGTWYESKNFTNIYSYTNNFRSDYTLLWLVFLIHKLNIEQKFNIQGLKTFRLKKTIPAILPHFRLTEKFNPVSQYKAISLKAV